MPRLRNAVTGVVVEVSDEKAERLGSGWVAVEEAEPAPAKKTAAKRTTTKK